jgi:hypothetical protein
MGSIAPQGDRVDGAPSNGGRPHTDPRVEAFSDLVAAFDRGSWPDGQLATRRLRQLGFSVCLIKPTGDRRPA